MLLTASHRVLECVKYGFQIGRSTAAPNGSSSIRCSDREVNGRTQREFFDQMLSESGRAWPVNLIDETELHPGSYVAVPTAISPRVGRIVDSDPIYLCG